MGATGHAGTYRGHSFGNDLIDAELTERSVGAPRVAAIHALRGTELDSWLQQVGPHGARVDGQHQRGICKGGVGANLVVTEAPLAQQRGEAILARSQNLVQRLARTLERGQQDVHFAAYTTLFYWCAVVMLVPEILVTLTAWNDWSVMTLPSRLSVSSNVSLPIIFTDTLLTPGSPFIGASSPFNLAV